MQDDEREPSLTTMIKDLLKKNPGGLSVTDIAKSLQRNKNTIGRYMDILLVSGQVNVRSFGMAKVFTYSPRLPISALLSYGRDCLIVLDKELSIIEVNDNLLKIIRLSRQETIGKNLLYLNPPEVDINQLVEMVQNRGGEAAKAITFQDTNGQNRIFHPRIVPIVLEEGKRGTTIFLEDVTDRVMSERRIREIEEQFRVLSKSIQDGLVIMEDNVVTYVNRRMAEITGYSTEELWKIDPFSIVTPLDKKRLNKKIKDIQRLKTQNIEIPTWITRKGGSERFVFIRVTVLPRPDKLSLFVVMTDYTDQAEKESALTESEERFRIMAENILEGLLIIEEGKVIYANQKISDIFGISSEELIERHVPGEGSADDTQGAGVEAVQSGDTVLRIEDIIMYSVSGAGERGEGYFWIENPDHVSRQVVVRVVTVGNEGKRRVFVIITDITGDRETEPEPGEQVRGPGNVPD